MAEEDLGPSDQAAEARRDPSSPAVGEDGDDAEAVGLGFGKLSIDDGSSVQPPGSPSAHLSPPTAHSSSVGRMANVPGASSPRKLTPGRPKSPGMRSPPQRSSAAEPLSPRLFPLPRDPDSPGPSTPTRGFGFRGTPTRRRSSAQSIAESGLTRASEDIVSRNGGENGGAGEGVEEEEDVPFESIALEQSSPSPGTVPLPKSPSINGLNGHAAAQRLSWSGAGSVKSRAPSTHSGTASPRVSVDPPEASETVSENTGTANANTEAGPSKPRLHAPPAHPHPFPIPTSPPRNGSSRVSSSSASADASAAGDAAPPAVPPAVVATLAATGIGVKGTSTFEKVLSHTRPSYLPPKPREEDDLHLHQWEEMMAQARALEKERAKAAEARRLEREKHLALNTPKWEALLNDPGFSRAKVQKDEALRKMWFDGVPGYLRGKAWSLAIGNPLAMSKDAYKAYSSRARKALDSGRFPQEILDRLEADMDQTLPTLKLLTRGSPFRDDVRELVCAWVVYRSDSGLGYMSLPLTPQAPYITHIATMLLLVSPPATAFLELLNLLARPLLRAFFTEIEDEIAAYYRVLENLQADSYPKIYANCKNLGLRLPESYFRGMLVEQIPFEAAVRLWDQIVLDGDGFVFRAALAIFGILEPRLYYPDREEILSVLEGRNKATQAIVDRERERARLRGEAYDESLDGKLSVFGLNEEALFNWLQTDGWKESRFERLLVREMPD